MAEGESKVRRVVDEEAVSVGGLGRVQVEPVALGALQGARVRAQLPLELAVGGDVPHSLELKNIKNMLFRDFPFSYFDCFSN